jgi:hypothetical protein
MGEFRVQVKRWAIVCDRLFLWLLNLTWLSPVDSKTQKAPAQKAEGIYIDGSRFQYGARILIAWATAIKRTTPDTPVRSRTINRERGYSGGFYLTIKCVRRQQPKALAWQ